ncbi:MAG: hypothetical protein D6815_03695 [Candidatus Dadabacteria bacterium]|nr:MAG: hypothetical protein D6815_03695 [Candidatus Dadabacteria bacterium]
MHPIRRIVPFLMPTRTESFVLSRQQIEARPAIDFLEQFNKERPPERRATMFHLLLRAIARVLEERPRLNRFIAGGRLYQRRGVWISFSAKQSMAENAPLFTCKRRFDCGESLGEMVDGVYETLAGGRAGRESATDREVKLLVRLPPSVLRVLVRVVRRLNDWNLLPPSMIANDPMFASVFVANLGSVGLDACYHHNYEYGTIPIFVVMGRLHRAPVVVGTDRIEVREVFDLKYTYDERIEDGFYCARALERLKYLLEHPAEL